ncbi:MAG: hypothetical protein U0872_07980 [Planctomycetaceae bacterium]
MDALFRLSLVLGALVSLGANYRTPNFVVTAPSREFAQQVGEAAEMYRRDLAIEWTGSEMPRWSAPCPIKVTVGMMGAGGATTFNFDRGEVFGWNMNIQGSEERILDSVLPHEINHTIFACYFRRPLPRWADEGAASLIEHDSERMRLKKLHSEVMGTNRKIPLKQLMDAMQYPTDQHQVLTLYAEGHSLADYLIGRSDKATYLKFINYAHDKKSWDKSLKKYFGYSSVESLEKEWDQWVMAGSPAPINTPNQMLAGQNAPEQPIVRGQSPEPNTVTLGAPSAQMPARTVRNDASPMRLARIRLQQPVAIRVLSHPEAGAANSGDATQRAFRQESSR